MLTYSSFDISTNFLGFSKTDDSIFNKSPVEDFWALGTFHGFSKTDDSIFDNSRVEGFGALKTVGIKDPPTTNDDDDDDKALPEFNKSIQLVNGT